MSGAAVVASPAPGQAPWALRPLDGVDWPALTDRLRARRDVVVVIPVFNGAGVVRACVRSVLRHSPGVRVVVIDDASTDPRTVAFLEELAADGVEIVRNPENLGYTRTANRGIVLAAPHDVVLLNSDTEVGPGWLTQLRAVAYSDDACASVTAISDNAGMFSFPASSTANSWPTSGRGAGAPWDLPARAVARGVSTFAQAIPTANGFAMYLRRTAIDAVGVFDAGAFPRGYGEENDWSRRAVAAGLVHLLAPRALVHHERSVSFGSAERTQLSKVSEALLTSRFPDYLPEVRSWGRSAELRALRAELGAVRDGARSLGATALLQVPAVLDVSAGAADARSTAAWVERVVRENPEVMRIVGRDEPTTAAATEAAALLGVPVQPWPSAGGPLGATVPRADLPDPSPWVAGLARTVSATPTTRVVRAAAEDLAPDALRASLASWEADPDVRVFADCDDDVLAIHGASAETVAAELDGAGFRCYLLDEARQRWTPFSPAAVDDIVSGGRPPVLYAVRAPSPSRSVAAVVHSGALGGAERCHVETVESLVRAGHMVHTIAGGGDLGLAPLLRSVGGSVVPAVDLPWWVTGNQARLAGGAGAVAPPDVLVTEICSVDPDVVLTQTAVVPQGALAAAMLRVPHVWFLHEFGDLDHSMPLPTTPRELGRFFAAYSEHVVTNSAAVRDHFFGGPAEGVSVLRPVSSALTERPLEPRADGAPWVVGIVGSLHPNKGQHDGVEAMAHLRGEGLDVRLRLYGNPRTAYARKLAELAEEVGVAEYVEIRGLTDDADGIYDGLDVVVAPSRSEAFGRVPTEAAAAGLPLVYADAAGLAEQMVDGVTGLAYAPGDSRALAVCIRRLVDSPDLRHRLVDAARSDLLAPTRREDYDRHLARVIDSASEARRRDDVHAPEVLTTMYRQARTRSHRPKDVPTP